MFLLSSASNALAASVTFNTNISKTGVDKALTMKLTGHKTLEMVLRYRHLDSEEAEQAMQKLDGFLEKKSKKN